MINFRKRPPKRPTNVVDEFWEQVRAFQQRDSEVIERSPPTLSRTLHHPINVALDYTRRYAPHILNAGDPMRAFADFWVPSCTARSEKLYQGLIKQACWERTSWIPFSRKVRVMPDYYEHNAYMFVGLLALGDYDYLAVSGRYVTEQRNGLGGFCKNNWIPPVCDGRWVRAEAEELKRLCFYQSAHTAERNYTVRLLQSMILTLLAPGGHTSFVIGMPSLRDGEIVFEELRGIVKNLQGNLKMAPAAKNPAMEIQSNGRTRHQVIDDMVAYGRFKSKGHPQNIPNPDPHIATDKWSVPIGVALSANFDSEAHARFRAGEDAVALDIARGCSIRGDYQVNHSPEPTPSPASDSQQSNCGGDSSPSTPTD